MRADRRERQEGGVVAEARGVGEAVDHDDGLFLCAVALDRYLPVHPVRVPPSAIRFNRGDKSGTDAYRSRLTVDRATNAADKRGTIMMRGWPVLVLGMALAGCGTQGGSNETVAANTTATSQGSGYIAKVLALPPRQLNGVLYRANR